MEFGLELTALVHTSTVSNRTLTAPRSIIILFALATEALSQRPYTALKQ
jgi:hypothetical protein